MWGTFSATSEMHTVCQNVCILQKIKIETKKLFAILGFVLCGTYCVCCIGAMHWRINIVLIMYST